MTEKYTKYIVEIACGIRVLVELELTASGCATSTTVIA